MLFDRSRYTFYENGPREKYFLDTRLHDPAASLRRRYIKGSQNERAYGVTRRMNLLIGYESLFS